MREYLMMDLTLSQIAKTDSFYVAVSKHVINCISGGEGGGV